MNVTLTSLEALILKATHESLPQPDVAALEAFYAIMRDSSEGPQYAAQALAARIHSSNSREAILALSMLDKCMRRGDTNFHAEIGKFRFLNEMIKLVSPKHYADKTAPEVRTMAEIGKFRFLNEMIKLVSPKHYADKTAPEVRTMVLQLIHAWSIEFPKETKFKVAYDMLKNQGVIKETPPPLPPEDTIPARQRGKNVIFEDDEKSKLLQKLLQSKKPEDLQHANRLIKTMVREEERRTEANSRKAQEVVAALDSAGLLRDMLEHASEASSDEEQLIYELHASCVRLRPVLQRLASSDAQGENLSEILHANDVLDEVFDDYNKFISEKQMKSQEHKIEAPTTNSSLLDFAGANINQEREKINTTAIDDLGDIFNNDSGSSNIADPIKPVNLMTIEDNEKQDIKDKKVEGWQELDSLGEQLLKQSLPNNVKRLDHFNSKHSKKIPMNALETSSPKHELANNNAIFDLDFFTKKTDKTVNLSPQAHSSKSITPNDDVMVDISSEDTSNHIDNKHSLKAVSSLDNILDIGLPLDNTNSIETSDENKDNVKSEPRDLKSKCEVKPLTDINVTLQSVQPSKVPPLTAFEEDEGLTVVLHFCKDKPRPDVNVVVISTTSKSKVPIEEYKFQAVVPKGCKVRLMEASGGILPAYNPFLPPPALTQLMLLATPPPSESPSLRLRFILTYTSEGDNCTEMGEALLPLHNI